MSAPRLISPLLDNFIMGEPIFDQGGIRILPAMEQEKQAKYIVKIVSIPANQNQVDALLLTGAYKDADSVNAYFAELADAVIQEAGVLNRLSNSGGFDGYENMQVVPMEDGNGYDVYLLAPYRPSWKQFSQQKPLTHLDGYNLALDICAALSVARRNGYIYANLKPDSVTVSSSGSYHIGDLGLMGLSYLQYSSLPTAYFSAYTAPEVADAYSSLNSTLDVYALGMMLYEIFNGGLPFDGVQASAVEYPAPAYAEEELAQIILKAVAPDPGDRWQDPTQMGQAIVSTMQRNGVSDSPILPIVQAEEPPAEEPADAEIPDEATDDQETVVVPEEPEVSDETEISEDIVEEPEAEQAEEESTALPAEETPSEAEDEPSAVIADEDVVPSDSENVTDISNVPDEVAVEESADVTDAEVAPDESAVVPEAVEEAVEGSEDVQNAIPVDITDKELDDILEEANLLIADNQNGENEEYEQLQIDDPELDVSKPDEEGCSPPKKSGKRIAAIICSVILLALLIAGGLFFYRHIYLQEIDVLSVSGKADAVSVAVVTDVASDKLSVVCTDANGNTFEADLVDYKATITGLDAETDYTVSLKIDGFHKLIGDTEHVYTTPEKTVISDVVVLNGTEAGTAEVTFKLSGPNEGNWTVTFTSADGAPHSATAIDGKAIVTGLTIGKTYSVTLSSSADLYLDEYVELNFTAGAVIKPIDPYVLSCIDGKLTVKWTAPEDALTWIVRCFNDDGYNETLAVTENTAIFNVPDDKKAYNIEISVKGQAAKETLSVTENAITLSDFIVDTSLPGRITLKWSANAEIPEGGYVVSYTVDGVSVDATIKTNANTVTILSAVPNAEHTFRFVGANGESILCAPVTAKATGKNPFSAFGIKAGNMRFNLCPRPTKANWAYKDVSTSAYTTTFTVGQKVGVAARILSKYYTSEEVVATVYAFRNSDGAIVHVCFTEEEWGDMWTSGYGTFDIPSLPSLPGSYMLEMYIDGGLVHQTDITIK